MKKLISLISTKGKTPKQVAEEMQKNLERYEEAKLQAYIKDLNYMKVSFNSEKTKNDKSGTLWFKEENSPDEKAE